jgi:hypothetical protein
MSEVRVVSLSGVFNKGLPDEDSFKDAFGPDPRSFLGKNATITLMTIHHTLVKIRLPTRSDIHVCLSSR